MEVRIRGTEEFIHRYIPILSEMKEAGYIPERPRKPHPFGKELSPHRKETSSWTI